MAVASIPLPSGLPKALQPPYDPPTGALPPIPSPVKRTRKSLPSPNFSRLPSAQLTPSRLRVPSKPALLTPVSPSPALATPPVPPPKDTPKSADEKNAPRSVSISAFPQPPKPGTTRIAKPSRKRPILAVTPSSNPPTSDAPLSPRPSSAPATPTSIDSLKLRKLRKPGKQTSLNSAYSNSPSLLSNGGESSTVPAKLSTEGLLQQGNSPSPSRSSSAQGSYSTQATTFEEDEVAAVAPPSRNTPSIRADSEKGSEKETKGNVLVSVRVRPNTAQDSKSDGEWMVDGRRSLVAFNGKESGDYFYDNVFAAHDDNARVYEASAKRLVRRVMEGYHGTVFAYGMTGTGKTFSMQGTTESPGVIPRAITDIFSFIRETPHREFLLRASYLEIYNEEIRDLLVHPTNGQPAEKIKLREDGKRGVYATPLREEIVQSPMQLLRVISRGDKARHTGHTQYNAHSSRSHAVVQIVVESRERATTIGEKRAAIGPGGVRVSTLSLIDLAGSERAADNKERRTEGAHINKSLLTLGTVIAKLSGSNDKQGNPLDADGKHLPYRDSKLTRLLQPALSGDSLISILCTIQIGCAGSAAASPNQHTGETLNTLKFAARAKNNIVSRAKKAEETVGVGAEARGLLERYRLEIETLRQQLTSQTHAQLEKEEDQMEKQAHNRHQDQLLELQLARTALKERIEHLNRLILSSQSTGVNYSGTFSALGIHPTLGSTYGSVAGAASVRSSTSMSTLLQRSASAASTATLNRPQGPARMSSSTALNHQDIPEDEEVIDTDEASLEAQNKALRSDLADKNRYISKLEQRLIQARRASSSRPTPAFHSAMLDEKDAEIAKLRLELAEHNRTITQLRAQTKASREPLKIDTSNSNTVSFSGSSITSPKKHQQNSSYGSTATTESNSFSPVQISLPKSPFEALAAQLPLTADTSPSNSIGLIHNKNANRKSIDEMSRMLDEMIQEKVEKGELTTTKNGSVRVVREKRLNSGANSPPSIGTIKNSFESSTSTDIGLGLSL